jgi:hypothetical protein
LVYHAIAGSLLARVADHPYAAAETPHDPPRGQDQGMLVIVYDPFASPE